jgi:hypothetical protein
MVWGRNEDWLEEIAVRGTSKVAVESNIREKRRVTERVCFFIIGSLWWRRRWSRRCCFMGCDWCRDLVEVDMILDLGNKLVESQQREVQTTPSMMSSMVQALAFLEHILAIAKNMFKAM